MKQLNLKRRYAFTIDSNTYGKRFYGTKVYYRGFSERPKIFKDRRGFSGGKSVLETLSIKFRKFELVIVHKTSRIRKTGKKYVVDLALSDLRQLNSRKYALAKEINIKTANNYFSELFPAYFNTTDKLFAYQKGMFVDILRHITPPSLSKDDLQSLIDFIPKILSYKTGKGTSLTKLLAGKFRYQTVYLERLLDEFEDKIKKGGSEGYWQEYLRNNLQFLQENYIKRIEKPNIGIDVRLPDFCLLTADNYLDVLEIKTPNTQLLKEDKSHKNYYWSSLMSQSISQVENYIDRITKNSDAFRSYLNDKHGLDIRIIKPRGLIIAGSSSEFGMNSHKLDNFRLLNESLKNITILTYDDIAVRVRNSVFAIKEYARQKRNPK